MDAHLERRLLTTATGLAGARRVADLVERLSSAFMLEPPPLVAGLALCDEERGRLVVHVQGDERAHELRLAEAPSQRAAPTERRALALDVPRHGDDVFLRLLADRGARALASAPLAFGQRPLGALFLGEAATPEAARLEYLAALARIVEPHVWGCFTDERFARGDRRRDALRELSRVINTALETRVVLHLARTAIGSIEGHRASWIGLFDQAGARWRCFDRPAEYQEEASEPPWRPVAGSLVAEFVGGGRTLESEDLAETHPFREEAELFARGVRRYVATPLRALGQTIGVFLFGTDDPHPPLRVDVWLIENVALQLALALHNAAQHEEIQRLSARREQQNVYLREEIKSEHDAAGMIGRSHTMRMVLERIQRVAGTDSTVLISGPTGVGKELVARAIHEHSARRDQPMVKLNCAAIPEGMVESELFGHERGAFTSAVERRVGRFELAQNGTLFLDEIGELSLGVQAKLLRVLQSGEFERVGGAKTIASNARIVAATNRDLARSLASGAFRADLFYRLNVFPIGVPTLAERREDIPLLAQAFMEQFARRMGKHLTGFAPSALEQLCRREWPGNVRELKHVIERAVILCDGPLLEIEEEAETRSPASVLAQPAAAIATLEELQDAHIRSALERTGGIIEGPRGAAALLGLKASTLRFRMKRQGIRRPGEA